MTYWDTKRKMKYLMKTETLTSCNFAAPKGTWTSSTFLEPSNLPLFGGNSRAIMAQNPHSKMAIVQEK